MLPLASLVQYRIWSLGVEEQVYLSWPAALLLLSSLGPTKRLISLAAMFFGSLLLCVFVMRGFPGMPILADAFCRWGVGRILPDAIQGFRVYRGRSDRPCVLTKSPMAV